MAIVVHEIKNHKYAYEHTRKKEKVVCEYLGPVGSSVPSGSLRGKLEVRTPKNSGGRPPTNKHEASESKEFKEKEREKRIIELNNKDKKGYGKALKQANTDQGKIAKGEVKLTKTAVFDLNKNKSTKIKKNK